MFRRRPPLPFQFRGEVPEEPSYEDLALLVAAAKRARPFKPMSVREQRQRTRDAQARAGIFVRIDRPVVNYAEFVPQMAAWYLQETAGRAVRTKLGKTNGGKALHVTLLDTRDPHEMLGNIDDSLCEEDILRKLGDRSPLAFRDTGRIAFSELELFGPSFKPWVALPIHKEARSLHAEREIIRKIISPNCGESDNRLHVSLGDITVNGVQTATETFDILKRGITPLLPPFGQFGPVRIMVGQNPQAEP